MSRSRRRRIKRIMAALVDNPKLIVAWKKVQEECREDDLAWLNKKWGYTHEQEIRKNATK